MAMATAADEEFLLRRERATITYSDGSGRRVFIATTAGDDYSLRRQQEQSIYYDNSER